MFAQIINVEKMRKTDDKNIQGKINLSLDIRKNTKTILRASNVVHLQYNKNNHTLLFLNGFSFLKVNDNQLINLGSQHLRYNYKLKKGITTLELFMQHQFNKVKLLNKRYLAGGGPRLKISDNNTIYCYLGLLTMYEYEKLNIEEKPISKKLRGDIYISLGFQVNELLHLSHTTYYQPDVSYWADYRIFSESTCKLKITEKLSYQLIFQADIDSKPPLDIPKYFYYLKNSLAYNF